MNKVFLITHKNILILCIITILNLAFSQTNKLFWDGRDWNRLEKLADYDTKIEFIIKKSYLEGALDGRLFGYLKTWEKDKNIADVVFDETVDYLTIRELIKNIDHFYHDPLNNYIPLPSAIIIANMYAKRLDINNVEGYILLTREWINELILNLDTLNYTKLLEQKMMRYHENRSSQSE